MTKKSRKSILVVLMLILVGLYFVSGTYARYASEITGNAQVETAAWAVAFKNGDNQAIEKDFNLTFTVQNNPNVVPGKIAPGVTATAKIKLDLTGTEVAVDYTAEITKTALTQAFGTSKVSLTVGGSDSATDTVELVGGKAFEGDGAIVEIPISITWENDENLNAEDIKHAGQELELPVKITVQQHI